eukprot:UN03165
MPNDIRVALALPTKAYSPDNDLRKLTIETLLAFCRNKPARRYLRAANVYFLVRELHKFEREIENDELDELIDDELIHYFLLDEDETELSWEEEQQRSLEQLERQSKGLALELEDDDETGLPQLDVDAQALKNVEAEKSVQAQLEPTEDGQIMDAAKYNSERERLHALEEARQEAAIQERLAKQKEKAGEYKADFLNFF